MKPSRRTTSRRTTSRRARHDVHENLVHEDLAAPAQNVPQRAPATTEDQLGAIAEFYTPLSLKTGAGRQYWDEVLRLLVNIRADCDAAAARLGYASHKDDGLAAVEYIGNKILEAVRGERRQQIASVQKPAGTRAPQGFKRSRGDHETKHTPENRIQRAGHPERAKLIDDLKQMLRERKTKSGVVIDPQLAHELAKQITILNEGLVGPETTESIKRMRERIDPSLAKLLDGGKPPSKPAAKPRTKAPAAAVARQRKQPNRSLSRPNKPMTKRSKARSR
jgi:hypothetical protein